MINQSINKQRAHRRLLSRPTAVQQEKLVKQTKEGRTNEANVSRNTHGASKSQGLSARRGRLTKDILQPTYAVPKSLLSPQPAPPSRGDRSLRMSLSELDDLDCHSRPTGKRRCTSAESTPLKSVAGRTELVGLGICPLVNET